MQERRKQVDVFPRLKLWEFAIEDQAAASTKPYNCH